MDLIGSLIEMEFIVKLVKGVFLRMLLLVWLIQGGNFCFLDCIFMYETDCVAVVFSVELEDVGVLSAMYYTMPLLMR